MSQSLPIKPRPNEWVGPAVLVPAYLLLISVGIFCFRHAHCVAAGNEPGFPQAVLMTLNAATLTGFQQARNPADYTPLGQAVSLVLIAGGTVFSLVAGGLAVIRIARLPYRDVTVVAGALIAVVATAVIGMVALPGEPRDRLYQSLSAFGNAGQFVGRLPVPTAWPAQAVLLPLAVLGGLGVPVLLDAVRGRQSAYTVRVVAWSAAVYVVSVAVVGGAITAHCRRQPGDGGALAVVARHDHVGRPHGVVADGRCPLGRAPVCIPADRAGRRGRGPC